MYKSTPKFPLYAIGVVGVIVTATLLLATLAHAQGGFGAKVALVQNGLMAVGALLGGAKMFTTLTPTQVDNRYQKRGLSLINLLLRIVNVIALNVGKDTNKDDE